MQYIAIVLLAAATSVAPALARENDNDALERVQKSGEVLSDILRAPDNGGPAGSSRQGAVHRHRPWPEKGGIHRRRQVR